MANTVEAHGVQTANVGSEHSLHSDNDAKTFICYLSVASMVPGDELELSVKVSVRSGTTPMLLQKPYIGPAIPEEKVIQTIPFAAPGYPNGIEFSIKQTAGTSRDFAWSVVTIG